MDKSIISVVVMVVVGVILIGSLLVPTVTGVQGDQKTTLTNTGSNSMFYTIDGDDDYTLKSNPDQTKFTINGNRVTVSSGTLLSTDQCRVTANGHYLALYDVSGTRSSNINTMNYLVIAAYNAESKVFTYTVYSGLTEASDVSETYSYNIEKNIIYMNPAGDYVAISNEVDGDGNYPSYYVNDINQIAAGGAYTTGDLDTAYFANGATVSVGNTSYSGSAAVTSSASDTYTDVMTCSGYTVTITDGTNSESFVPFTTYVPAKITAHTEKDNSLISLLGVISVIFVISLAVVSIRLLTRDY